MKRKRGAAYCRVSTDKEDQQNSLETQRTYFREHIERNGYEMVQIYADEGITGTKKRNRKAFLQMLEDAGEEEKRMQQAVEHSLTYYLASSM